MTKIIQKILCLVAFAAYASSQAVDNDFCAVLGVDLGVLPHPVANLCQYFIVCIFGTPSVFICADDEIFVADLGSIPPNGRCQPGKII